MAINSLSASSHGLSGLVSGMDTQQMVESMLAGTQGKIDAANQKKSQLNYKQQMYRDVAAKLKTFQSSFFDYAGSTSNLRSPDFFRSMVASSSSSAFKATASSKASTEKTVVNYVRQLAQNLKAKTSTAATGKLEGTFDSGKVAEIVNELRDGKNSLKISVDGGVTTEIKLDQLAGKSEFQIEEALQNALTAAGSTAKVEFKSGQFTFTEATGKALTINGTEKAMAVVGLGRESALYGKDGKITTKLNGNNLLPSITATLDGVKKSLYINPLTITSGADLATQLNDELKSAFGANASATFDATTGKVTFSTKDKSSVLTLVRPGSQANGLDFLGIASNSSTKLSQTVGIKDVNLQQRVAGDVQRFSIGGVDFSFGSDATLSEIFAQINSSEAGVKISYLDVEDRFVIESKVSGESTAPVDPNNPFAMSQQEGNLLTALFGAQPGSAASSNKLIYNKDAKGTTYPAGELFDLGGKSFTIKVGESARTISFTPKADGSKFTLKEAVDTLNDTFNLALGSDFIEFSIYTDGSGQEGLAVKSKHGKEFELGSGFAALGITEGSKIGNQEPKTDTLLSDLGIDVTKMTVNIKDKNGVTLPVDLSSVKTVGELERHLNAAVGAVGTPPSTTAQVKFDESTGRYRIFGIDIPMTFEIKGDDGKLFGASEFTLGAVAGGTTDLNVTQQGQNAIVSINGSEVVRSTNEFTLAGISYELKEVNIKQAKDAGGNLLYLDNDGNKTTSDKDPSGNPYRIAGADNAEGITISRDTEKVFESLQKFVDEYNKLVNGINELIDEDPSYRDYPPLTTKQKEAMSDREVELWEKKAKEGLLRNDRTLETVMQSMRGTLYQKPDNAKLALYDIGITTQYFGKRDNLTLDVSKLKQALAENPDEIATLFTDPDKGFGKLMNDAIESAVSISSTKPGTIVQQAGSAGLTDTSSFIYKEVKGLDDRLKSLNKTYEKEYNRYWAQFNKMEQVIAQMNQQSSWLGQQTG